MARTGSYPYRDIAEDHGLPYWVVLCYADQSEAIDRIPDSHLHEEKYIEDARGYWGLAAIKYIRNCRLSIAAVTSFDIAIRSVYANKMHAYTGESNVEPLHKHRSGPRNRNDTGAR